MAESLSDSVENTAAASTIRAVHADTFVDDAAAQFEVLKNHWHFLAHRSEVANPGDFVVRYIGQDSIIVCHGKDGEVRAFHNVCRHRGMQVCRAELGNTTRFTCPYHGWLYDTTGRLTSLPLERPYFAAAGLDRENYGLVPLNGFEELDGFLFGRLTLGDGRDLADYLGDFAWYLQIHTRRDPNGMEVVGEPQRWRIRTNWKLGAENFMGDSYHAGYTHRSVLEIGLHPNTAGDFQARGKRDGVHINAGPGTLSMARQSAADRGYPPDMVNMFTKALPEAQRRLLFDGEPFWPTRTGLFPNLSMLNAGARLADGNVAPFLNLRIWRPLGPDLTEVWSWVLVESSASAEFKERSQRAYVLTFGTTGTEEQDDVENFTAMQRNFQGAVGRGIGQVLVMGDGLTPEDLAIEWDGPGVAFGSTYTDAGNRYFSQLYANATGTAQ